jgi:NAD(P)-dependent dehydrogenase (short-subunit alcohol dehydrogenase family)
MTMVAPILVFGATGGVGSALARRLAATGTPLFLTARSAERLAALGSELNAPYAAADATDTHAVADVVARAAGGDGLAGLAYCVGSIVLKPLKAATEQEMMDAFRLNAVGAAMAVKAAQTPLAAAGGAVVLFSTVAVAQGFTFHTIISAAKGAVEGLTRALAAELAPKVRVNAVAPSLTRTPLADSLTRNPAMAKGIADLHALPRLGESEDIAATAAFLLSADASWITGQVIAVDGGRSRVRTKG